MVKTIISGFVFAFGLMHLYAGLHVSSGPVASEGTLLNLMQGFVFMPGAILLHRSMGHGQESKPSLDEVMTSAIRERAVDNLIDVQRETQGGHA